MVRGAGLGDRLIPATAAVALLTLSLAHHSAGGVPQGCGDGRCARNETKASCPTDCDETTCRELYRVTESGCIERGWTRLHVEVAGIRRELLWKGPPLWTHGAVIVLHGGEGVDSNFCFAVPRSERPRLSDVLRGVPAERFGSLAVEEGFAVFSLNSTLNRITDASGTPIGKRWASLKQDETENVDLEFIEHVIDHTIPALRPEQSRDEVFIAGISNGGFMATLAATHLSEKVAAFAPVSAGDPYGMYFDMSRRRWIERPCAPGTWRDLETDREIHEKDACRSGSYPNEKEWPPSKRSVPFRQFFHEGDGGVDMSCMEKARTLLTRHGYEDRGALVLRDRPGARRTLEKHFWQHEYNRPILDFFKQASHAAPGERRLDGSVPAPARER